MMMVMMKSGLDLFPRHPLPRSLQSTIEDMNQSISSVILIKKKQRSVPIVRKCFLLRTLGMRTII